VFYSTNTDMNMHAYVVYYHIHHACVHDNRRKTRKCFKKRTTNAITREGQRFEWVANRVANTVNFVGCFFFRTSTWYFIA